MAKVKRKKAKTTKAATIKKDTATLIGLKVTESEKRAIQRLAKKYAGGNLSLWLRVAGMNFTPGKNVA